LRPPDSIHWYTVPLKVWPAWTSWKMITDRMKEIATPIEGDGMRAGAAEDVGEEAGKDGAEQRRQGNE
jgi:hypothetical protein